MYNFNSPVSAPPPPSFEQNIIYHKVISWISILKPETYIPLFSGISQYYTMPSFSHQLVNSQQPAHENMKTSSLFVWKRAIQINRFCKWNSDIRLSYSLALIVCCWITRGEILFHRSIKLFGRARGCRQGDCVSIVVDVVTAYEGLLL